METVEQADEGNADKRSEEGDSLVSVIKQSFAINNIARHSRRTLELFFHGRKECKNKRVAADNDHLKGYLIAF